MPDNYTELLEGGAAAPANPYLDILGRDEAARDAQFRASATQAVDVNPDQVSARLRVAKYLGMPPPAVDALPADAERAAKLKQLDTATQGSPVTRQAFTDADFARLAHDDADNLTLMEKAVGALKYVVSAPDAARGGLFGDVTHAGRALASGIPTFSGGVYGAAAAPFELVGLDGVGGFFRDLQHGEQEKAKRWAGIDPNAGLVERGVFSGLQSAGQNLITLPLGLANGARVAGTKLLMTGEQMMLAAMGITTGGQSYGKARDAGMAPAQAIPYAVEDAVAEVVTEKFMGASGLLSQIKANSSAAKMLMYEVTKEVPGEVTATLWQNFNEWMNLHPEQSVKDFLAAQPADAAETVIATLVGGGTQIGLVHGAQKLAGREQQAQQAERGAEALQQMSDLAAASKVRGRDVSTFENFVRQANEDGPVSDVYLSATALQQSGVDVAALAQASPAVAEQLQTAAATGGDIRIPVEEFAGRIAGTDFAQSLIPHLRTEPGGMSQAEAQQFMQSHADELHAEVERTLAEKQGNDTYAASRDAVAAQMLEQLNAAGRFTPDVNRTYADMIGNFYAVQGAKVGLSAEQMAERYPLQVRAERLAGAKTLDQAPAVEAFNDLGSGFTVEDGKLLRNGAVVGDIKLEVESGGKGTPHLVVRDIRVTNKGNGIGTMALAAIMGKASQYGLPVALTSEGMLGKAHQKRLRAYYERIGFKKNKGADKVPGVREEFVWTPPNTLNQSAFHGSPHKFDKFSTDNVGSGEGGRALGWGLYFTSSREVAERYKNPLRKFKEDGGNVYGAEIPEDDELLLWGETLADQSPKVRAAIYASGYTSAADGMTGEELYRDTSESLEGGPETEDADRMASELFRSLGIKGVKHQAKDGSNTYVVFSGEDAAIRAQLDQGKPGARGSITLGEDITQTPSVITLLQRADLSTFLHESGHFYLEVLSDMASREDAPQGVKDDMAAVLKWFGVPDLATWNGYDIEQKRDKHEQFARGFEAYLFEGRAPSVELAGMFQRFRAWLLNVYRSLSQLNVTLNDEVRGVFDRMLASTQAIQEAEAVRGYAGLFETKPDFMTDEEWLRYQALGQDATQLAIHDLESRSLRDMQWLSNAKSRKIKELQREAAGKRKAIRAEVEAEVMAAPINLARRFLTHGELPDADRNREQRRIVEDAGMSGTKLNLADLKEMYGTDPAAPWRYLTTGERGLATAEGGMHPDLVAELFGFTSGDHLVRELLAAEKPAEKIEGITDQRMLERYGDLTDEKSIARAADEALHDAARTRFVATELAALEAASGGKRTLAKAARQFAEAIIARLKVRNIRPAQYSAAAARAAKAADAAFKKGDIQAAAVEKRNQLVNSYADRAAHEAQAEVDKALAYFKKFDTEGTRKNLDAEYLDQVDQLLARFDLRSGQSLRAIDKRKSLLEWAEGQREQGFEPDIPPELLAEASRKSYKDMTVEELRGLRDTVKQIEHLARLKHKLLTAKDQREYEAVRDEIAASINENAGDRRADTRTPTTNTGRAVQGLKRFFAAHVKVATWARILDGGRDGGPVWEYFVRSANERGDMETTMRAEATTKLSDILAPVFKLGKMGGKGVYFPTIGRSLNRESRIAIALNVGNQSNLQRLLGGEGWTMAQVQPVLDSLSKTEWDAVQAIWDHFESYRPLIEAKEKRVYGKAPQWLEASPVQTPHGEYRGGYYPVKYDPAASQRAEEHADAEGAKRQLQGAYTSATTRRSFTKTRAEEVHGRPLLYSLAGLYSGVNDVIHDLSWHEWLIDANRLLKSTAIDNAIRSHYGPEAKAQFKSWANDIAEGEKGADNAGEIALGKLRQNVSVAGLGFNVMSAALQGLGMTQSIVRVGPAHIGRGIVQYLAGPIDATREVNEKSEFMRNRARTRYRELNELRNRVQADLPAADVLKQHAYVLMMRCQQTVDVPTWLGAYDKAIGEGNDEDRAIALADQAVIDAQGGGQLKDVAAIERGGQALKLFTVFYSFMNTAFNLGVAETMTESSKARLAAKYLMLYSVPAVLGTLLKDALTPGDAGDDDWKKLSAKLLSAQLSYLMGLMVVSREFAAAADIVTGQRSQGYAGPAGVRMVGGTLKFGQQAMQGQFDDSFRKASINLAGDLLGLPGAQINRTVTGTKALAEGKTHNPAAIAFGFQEKR